MDDFIIFLCIVAVFVLAYFIFDTDYKNKHKETENEKCEREHPTEVNIPLQIEVEKRMKEVVKNDIDIVHPEVENLYNYMGYLCYRYGLHTDKSYSKSEINNNDKNSYSRYSVCIDRVHIKECLMPERTYRIEDKTFVRISDGKSIEDIFKEVREKYTIRERIEGKPFLKMYKNGSPIPSASKELFENPFDKPYNEPAHTILVNWWKHIMERAMREYGYKYSPSGKEIDSLAIRYEESIAQPWLHGRDHIDLELIKNKKKLEKRKQKQEAEAKAYRERFEK